MKPPHKNYECPKCGEWIEILPTTGENFSCPWCSTKLHLDIDAEFENGSWRDLSKLRFANPWDDPETAGAYDSEWCYECEKPKEDCGCDCQHKYAEQSTAPLGVKCVKCGHFVGAWE